MVTCDRMLPPMHPTGHPEPARPGPRYKVNQKPAGRSGSQKGRALDSVIPIALFLVLNRIWGLGAGVAGATLWSIKVAVDRRRRGESVGRFLPILVVYYPVMQFGVDMAKTGQLPVYSVWIGNMVLFFFATLFLRKVNRY